MHCVKTLIKMDSKKVDNKCILYTNKILRVLNACLGILYNFVIKLDIIKYYIEEKCETRFSLLYSIYVI